jgi:UDP-N-acetylglucosamine acyltransferase
VGTGIHPTAVVDPAADLAAGVEIGPYCVVGPDVRLGEGCRLMSHVVMAGPTTIGPRCRFFPFATIGECPQDLKFRGEMTRLEIGADNTFRESITVHRGTAGGGGVTRIGSGNFFMAGVHVAHDCRIGDGVIMANAAALAGHVTVMDGSTVGAFSGVHQFCRIGRQAFIGGYSVVTQDALPYVLTVGNRAESHGINVIGLKRRGLPAERIQALRRAYRTIFRSKLPREAGLEKAEEEWGAFPEVEEMIRFIRETERGVVA